MKSDEMRKVFEKWEASGMSLYAFAKREGQRYGKLLYWKKKFRSDAEPAPCVELVPVQVVPDPVSVEPASGVVSVWLPNGVSLEVPLGLDGGELERLVRTLSAC